MLDVVARGVTVCAVVGCRNCVVTDDVTAADVCTGDRAVDVIGICAVVKTSGTDVAAWLVDVFVGDVTVCGVVAMLVVRALSD